jgi:hypothetical protein
MRSVFIPLFLLILCPSFAAAGSFEDGTLLFLENSSNIVECYTDSTYTHVAIILSDEKGEQWLYNAEPPKVRKYRVLEYFESIGKMNESTKSKVITSIVRPQQPYTKDEVASMRAYLDGQVGRRYSIRGYLRKIAGDGIHCSEMCAAAVESTGRHNFTRSNYQISPGYLQKVTSLSHRQQGKKLLVETKKKDRQSLCSRWSAWWGERGTLCGWSCWETLRFCW